MNGAPIDESDPAQEINLNAMMNFPTQAIDEMIWNYPGQFLTLPLDLLFSTDAFAPLRRL
jgi:hypothetical protein